MRFYSAVKEDTDNEGWWVECGLTTRPAKDKEPVSSYTEIGCASEGKTKATALRKAARNFEREAKRLFKEAEKCDA